MEQTRDYQAILEREGYVVVPTPLTDQALRMQVMVAYLQHFRESPEFRAPRPEDPMWQPVLGGFAGLANPSSCFDDATHDSLRCSSSQPRVSTPDGDDDDANAAAAPLGMAGAVGRWGAVAATATLLFAGRQ